LAEAYLILFYVVQLNEIKALYLGAPLALVSTEDECKYLKPFLNNMFDLVFNAIQLQLFLIDKAHRLAFHPQEVLTDRLWVLQMTV